MLRKLVPLVALLLPASCLRLGSSEQLMLAAGAALPAGTDTHDSGWYVVLGDLYGGAPEGARPSGGWRVDFVSVPLDEATVLSVDACYLREWQSPRVERIALITQAGAGVHFADDEVGIGPAIGVGVSFCLAKWGMCNALTLSGRYVHSPIWIEDDFPSSSVDTYLVGFDLIVLVR